MAKTISNVTRRASLGDLIMVIADVNITDYPWLGQPILPEDFGVSQIECLIPLSQGGTPGDTFLGCHSTDKVREITMRNGVLNSGLGRWQNFLTTAAVTDTVNNGAGYAVGVTAVVVADGTKFAAGDMIVFNGGDKTKAQYNIVGSVSVNTLTLKYRIPAALLDAAPVAIVRRGIGTGVTLSGAVAVNDTTIGVSSATGILVGDVLALSGNATTFVDARELVLVRGVSGTTITIESLASGLAKAAAVHSSGAKVYKVPPPPKIRAIGTTIGVDPTEGIEIGNVRMMVFARS